MHGASVVDVDTEEHFCCHNFGIYSDKLKEPYLFFGVSREAHWLQQARRQARW